MLAYYGDGDKEGNERGHESEREGPRAQSEVGASPTLKRGPFLDLSIFSSTKVEFLEERWATINDRVLGSLPKNLEIHADGEIPD